SDSQNALPVVGCEYPFWFSKLHNNLRHQADWNSPGHLGGVTTHIAIKDWNDATRTAKGSVEEAGVAMGTCGPAPAPDGAGWATDARTGNWYTAFAQRLQHDRHTGGHSGGGTAELAWGLEAAGFRHQCGHDRKGLAAQS